MLHFRSMPPGRASFKARVISPVNAPVNAPVNTPFQLACTALRARGRAGEPAGGAAARLTAHGRTRPRSLIQGFDNSADWEAFAEDMRRIPGLWRARARRSTRGGGDSARRALSPPPRRRQVLHRRAAGEGARTAVPAGPDVARPAAAAQVGLAGAGCEERGAAPRRGAGTICGGISSRTRTASAAPSTRSGRSSSGRETERRTEFLVSVVRGLVAKPGRASLPVQSLLCGGPHGIPFSKGGEGKLAAEACGRPRDRLPRGRALEASRRAARTSRAGGSATGVGNCQERGADPVVPPTQGRPGRPPSAR